MKQKYNFYKIAVTLLLILSFSFNNFAQVDISTNAVYLNNQISNCSNIDLNLNNTHYITLNIHLEKFYSPYNDNGINDEASNGIVKIILSARGGLTNLSSISINESDWTINLSSNTLFINISKLITIYNTDLDDYENDELFVTYENGSVIYGDTSLCPYTITRPYYHLNPSNISVSCGQSGANFNVSDIHNSPGSLEYHWNVGNGWKRNGSIVHTFTTTTNNIDLEPYQFPPSNVSVTPYLDGIPYDTLTSVVHLSEFTTTNDILGQDAICSKW